MFCRKCGKEVASGSRFCRSCGAPVTPAPAQQPTYIQPQPVYTPQYKYGMPMNWFGFYIYAYLFISAGFNVINGILTIFGVQYGGDASFLYEGVAGLRALDIAYGISALAFAGYTLLVRFRLAAFKKGSLLLFYLLPVIGTTIGLSYQIIFMLLTNGNYYYNLFVAEGYMGLYTVEQAIFFNNIVSIVSVAFSVIVNLVILIVNIKYFNKRKHLFVK